MENKLKPCPFCGGQARFKTTTYGEDCSGVFFRFKIECRECKMATPKVYNLSLMLGADGETIPQTDERNIAIEKWNNRPKED